jgi:hypothetical protein
MMELATELTIREAWDSGNSSNLSRSDFSRRFSVLCVPLSSFSVLRVLVGNLGERGIALDAGGGVLGIVLSLAPVLVPALALTLTAGSGWSVSTRMRGYEDA